MPPTRTEWCMIRKEYVSVLVSAVMVVSKQKLKLYMKDRIIQIANLTINAKRDNPQRNRVYHPEGIGPCLSCMGGGDLKPLIPVVYESH